MRTLKQIKEICEAHNTCDGCPFNRDTCFAETLPARWDLEKIEKHLSEYEESKIATNQLRELSKQINDLKLIIENLYQLNKLVK